MNFKKIAVLGSFGAGAALALAPLAAAAPAVDITSTLDSEIASMNSMFEFDTFLAGVSGDVTKGTGIFDSANPWDVITPGDVHSVQGDGTTLFDFLIYGVNPTVAGLASDPGSYSLFNGALTEFDDAYNVMLYSLLSGGQLIPADELFGSESVINAALGTGTAMGAMDEFLQVSWGDLLGYLGIFIPA